VTVYIDKALRGCIGNAVAVGPLYRSIVENAIYAVSLDNRFEPINVTELPRLTVDVSVLSPLEEYHPIGQSELLKYLKKVKPGLMLAKNGQSALFLPQVWQELPEPTEFLKHLCLKAGLNSNDWQSQMDFWTFTKI
jgi:AmmeMemoRadiSam system protein A